MENFIKRSVTGSEVVGGETRIQNIQIIGKYI